MNKNDFQQNRLAQAVACVLAIGSVAWAYNSDAATATGTATATVVEAVSISIKKVVTTPALSGTLFTIESFTSSLSLSGPLLRFGSAPPPCAVLSGAGAALLIADKATVNVTLNADGSLSVSGGSGLTFAVSQPGACVINIEYN